MRLWHYQIIRHLPRSQLLAQWREINSILKKRDRHILINYVYDYPEENLLRYANIVAGEMAARGFRIRSWDKYLSLVSRTDPAKVSALDRKNPFPNHHTDRYFIQCFFNLQEKFDRGQKDYDAKRYDDLARVAETMMERGMPL